MNKRKTKELKPAELDLTAVDHCVKYCVQIVICGQLNLEIQLKSLAAITLIQLMLLVIKKRRKGKNRKNNKM